MERVGSPSTGSPGSVSNGAEVVIDRAADRRPSSAVGARYRAGNALPSRHFRCMRRGADRRQRGGVRRPAGANLSLAAALLRRGHTLLADDVGANLCGNSLVLPARDEAGVIRSRRSITSRMVGRAPARASSTFLPARPLDGSPAPRAGLSPAAVDGGARSEPSAARGGRMLVRKFTQADRHHLDRKVALLADARVAAAVPVMVP